MSRIITAEQKIVAIIQMRIKTKRVYEQPDKDDGTRILVDRLWPRGLSKEKAQVDLWLKEIAPGTELRDWFGHDPKKWVQFRRRYFRELTVNTAALEPIIEAGRHGPVTLMYSSHDMKHNNAVALKDFVEGQIGKTEHRAARK